MRTLVLVLIAIAWTLALAACGGKKDEAQAPAGDAPAAHGDPGHDHGTAAGEEMSPEEMADSTAARLGFTYRTRHDPSRVYTLADVPQDGAYLKLDFEGLDDAAVNRVMHRFMTEPATCEGCDGLVLDEVLRNLPDCGHCIIQARKLLREMRGAGAEG